MNVRILALLLGLSAIPVAAQAQEMEAAPKCAAMVAPPAALSGWSDKTSLTAAAKADGLAKAQLRVDHGAKVTLHTTREVTYVTQPDEPGGSVAHGGLLSVSVAQAGTYQINLSSGAWIDLLKNGTAIVSTAHKPGPACTGIRKTVQFPLQPGNYVLQISANATPDIQVMVSRVP